MVSEALGVLAILSAVLLVFAGAAWLEERWRGPEASEDREEELWP